MQEYIPGAPPLPRVDANGLGDPLDLSLEQMAKFFDNDYSPAHLDLAQDILRHAKGRYVRDVHCILQQEVRNELNQHLNAAQAHRNHINQLAAEHGHAPLDSELLYFPPEWTYTLPSQLFGGSMAGDGCITICSEEQENGDIYYFVHLNWAQNCRRYLVMIRHVLQTVYHVPGGTISQYQETPESEISYHLTYTGSQTSNPAALLILLPLIAQHNPFKAPMALLALAFLEHDYTVYDDPDTKKNIFTSGRNTYYIFMRINLILH